MKAAEDLYFECNPDHEHLMKSASEGQVKTAVFPFWMKAMAGGLLGSSTLLALLAAYRRAGRASPVRARLAAIKEALRNRLRGTPVARMAPYTVQRTDPEEERRRAYDRLAATLRERRVTPVEMQTGGSPAAQARANTIRPTEVVREKREEEEEKKVPLMPAAPPAPTPAPVAAAADFY
jgi:hypothetical protein